MHGKSDRDPLEELRVVCILFKLGSDGLPAIAEACYRFTPQIAIREGEAIFLEVGKSRHLFKEEGLALKLRTLCFRFGFSPKVTIAEDVPTALALARYTVSSHMKKSFLPLEALLDYASPFKQDLDLEKSVLKLIEILKALGVRNLQEFHALPQAKVISRFGKESAILCYRLQSTTSFAWPVFKLPEKIIERSELVDPETLGACSNLEPLLFLLRAPLDRAMARLRGRCQRVSAIRLSLDLENRTTREWKILLPVPQGSSFGLLPILRDRLSFDFGRSPLQSSVVSASFEVLETVPGHGSQHDFFNSRESEAEAWDALVGRLATKLGKERAFLAQAIDRYLPEKAWAPTLKSKSLAGELCRGTPKRPSRILKNPEPLRKQRDLLMHCKRVQVWKTLEWHGPERLSGEWWDDSESLGFQRDYYRVRTDEGNELWVFSDPSRGLWTEYFYLHGYFD